MPKRWNINALTRKSQIESGVDLTFSKVFLPLFVNFVKSVKPLSLIEVGAGTGHLSLELSKYIQFVTAVEPSTGMYEIARDVLKNTDVDLRQVAIADLKNHDGFDLAISHMCIQCIEDDKSFLRDIGRTIRDHGRLLVSLPHPCFYNDYKQIFTDKYCYMDIQSTEISFSISLDPIRKISGVPYCHRPLSHYINSINSSGFFIEKLEEIFPEPAIQSLYPEKWEKPRYILFHLYKANIGEAKI